MKEEKIYKYVLDILDVQDIEMPAGAKILCVENVNDTECMWVRVKTDAKMETRRVLIVGTGHPLNVGTAKYVGTAPTVGGRLVWHVFDAGVA